SLSQLSLTWDLHANRKGAYDSSRINAAKLHDWMMKHINEEQARSLGFSLAELQPFNVENEVGTLSKVEVHSVRPVRRVGPDGQNQLDLVVELTQSWTSESGSKYRGGSTVIVDVEKQKIRYVVRKSVASAARIEKQRSFRLSLADTTVRSNYHAEFLHGREPFAMLHRGA
ncbi:MAG TPA: hypothetical protein VL866_19975, partial [Pyrinomonadaceae bacterium]|nr:hypothetical protein [Pyrinomonadaceae bacterium]